MAEIFNLFDTWDNVSTTYSAIKMDVTDTASDANSYLIDLQTDSVQMFNVSKDGDMYSNTLSVSEFGYISIGNTTVNTQINSISVTSTDFDNVSDRRLKENIIEIDETDAIFDLTPVSFTWKHVDDKRLKYGFIAQDVEGVIPNIVNTNDDDILSVSYTQIIPLLIAVIKKQQKQIDELYETIHK